MIPIAAQVMLLQDAIAQGLKAIPHLAVNARVLAQAAKLLWQARSCPTDAPDPS